MRCSELDRLFACPGSGHVTVKVRGPDGPARLGTGMHVLLARMALGGNPFESVEAVAQQYGCDETDLRVLAAQGRKLWELVKGDYPESQVELGMSAEVAPGVILSGHVDVVSLYGDCQILDWKSSRVDTSYEHQMRGYAWLALACNSTIERATATVAWVRECEVERYSMDRQEARAWQASVVDRIVQWDGAYRPGSHCEYCPRSHECPAANALARRDVAALLDTTPSEAALDALTPEQLVDLLLRAKTVSKLADSVEQAIKAMVAQRGPIVAGGKTISLEPKERRGLRTLAAWPVLEASGFGDVELAEIAALSISKAESIVAKRAGRGKGAGAVREFQAALEAAKAIETTVSQTLTVKRAS